MSYVSSIELRKVRPEAVQSVARDHLDSSSAFLVVLFSEKSVIESVVDLFHDVVDKVPQVSSIHSDRQEDTSIL